MSGIEACSERIRGVLEDARRGLIERDALVELIALAAVAGEHLLVIGPPGTAKSEAVRRIARGLEATYFEYLLGRFTEPSEIFGPVDLRKLREGIVETETRGMLPEAQIAFLDEIFLGSTAILNTLLALLNERVFRRGHTSLRCPLRVCIGASNALPEGDALAAFADRFLLRIFVEPVSDTLLEDLLERGWSRGQGEPRKARVEDLDVLAKAAQNADLSLVRRGLAEAIRLLLKAGILLSDRRVVKVQQLVAAAAVLDGRPTPGEADLWPLVYAIPTAAAQGTAREVLRDLLGASRNRLLSVASEEASQGPLARAARLLRTGQELLAGRGGLDERTWRLRLEGVAREIDAGFSVTRIPPELASLREQIVGILRVE
ncbi:MAG: AAA family ATPase [Myxococcales bacterium]|nr:AAA family ATPase [Polyangiaceae bacterium]MDW8251586.1 AAA family ATPase [Myxococcales bacterium]